MSFADEMRKREREKLGRSAVRDPAAPADLPRVEAARSAARPRLDLEGLRRKGAEDRARTAAELEKLKNIAATPGRLIDTAVVEPFGAYFGGLFDRDLEKPIGEVLTGGPESEPEDLRALADANPDIDVTKLTPAERAKLSSTPAPAPKTNPADAATQFVNDRTSALPAGLRRYSGSELGAAVYEGRTKDGQRYFTNRPFENLDGKRRLNVADTGTTYGARTVPGGLFRGPTYERGSIVPPPDETNGAFEFQLDRSTGVGGPAGRTYPEFAPDDVMPAVKDEDLRGLSMADRERFDVAQREAETGAQYQNAPLLAERDEQVQRSGKAQAELLAGMTPAQQAKYFADQDSALNRREDNIRADNAAAYQATRDKVVDARTANAEQREGILARAKRANDNPSGLVDTTDFDTSDAGIEKFLTEEASAPERAAISTLLGSLAVDSGLEQYSQATLLRELMADEEGGLSLPNPGAWPWQDDEFTLDATKLRTSNPEALDVLRKIGMRNRGLTRGNR